MPLNCVFGINRDGLHETSPLFSPGGFPFETEVFSPCFDFSVLSSSILSNLRVRLNQSKGYFLKYSSAGATTSNSTSHVFLLCVTTMFHFCVSLYRMAVLYVTVVSSV